MARKIGDRVTRQFEGDICRVIATKEESHKIRTENGEFTGEELFVPTDADYIIVSEDKLKSKDKFSPYISVTEKEIKDL